MQRSDYAFHPLSWTQYQAIVTSGSFPNVPEPMLNQPDYTSLIAVLTTANIDPRLALAFTWAEGHDGTDPGLVAASVNNLGGIKFSGAPGTYDSKIPADTGGTYAGFPDLTAYWQEWVRVMNNSIIGPSFNSGDLVVAVGHYTNGPGTGTNKVDKFLEYVSAYPAGGSVTDTGVYGEDIVAALLPHLGEMNSTGALDPWNTPAFPNHPWAGWCESLSEGAQYAAGLTDVVHRGSAALKLDAVTAQGLLQTSWPPEDGGICLWGRSFDPQGHTAPWSAAKQMWISTLYPPHPGLDYFYSDAWKAAMAGWYRAPGVVAANRPTPLPAPVPPQTPFFVDGNPNGPIPVRDLFWARWDAVNAMGTKLDHPGVVNPQGLALPTFGYPVEAERTLPTGRRIQRFERVYLAVDKGAEPFNVVVLLLSEQPA